MAMPRMMSVLNIDGRTSRRQGQEDWVMAKSRMSNSS